MENKVKISGIFDSHAHYDASQFSKDRESLLSDLPNAGVCGVLNVGADLESSQFAISLARKFDYIYAAVGIHPESADSLPENWLTTLEGLSKHQKVVAIGEIGIDYHYTDACPKEKQREVFIAQLELAKQLDLPVVLHDRDAHGDMMDILTQYRPRGVLHCYSGSVEMARQAVKLGLYLGIGGVVTFKNARQLVEVATDIPLDRLMFETDAPYLSPEPLRGKRNDSRNIRFIAQKVAALCRITVQEALDVTADNVRRLFAIPTK